ncbi:hypothetical protein [Amycolatopsis pithecellobii]|uniref:Uncharacterized protein n=1 Tax=Amycolatopsis pithecellobii TaxID=664692 RepID=A0A6N7YJK6_9PSEU|nr:hypothetical protein [Amycolatopsis pithecellobii]MTD53077.1 hypothetical protein [Amycolatopsis pithecellobii]
MTEFSIQELSLQGADLLPAREALSTWNTATINALNAALAVNHGSGLAAANAEQTIVVIQN